MSSLRSVLDERRSDSLASLSDAELGARVDELERAMRVIGPESARSLVEVEREASTPPMGSCRRGRGSRIATGYRRALPPRRFRSRERSSRCRGWRMR
jgi:hypothetical protein